MPFYATPSGGYGINSVPGTANICAIYDYLHPLGYTKECVAGMCGNMAWESGLNPWRWQGDTVNYNAGYGLVQYTHASDYINLTGIPDHAPNLSTTEQTAGASPDDAKGQLYVFVNNTLGKWVSNCWNYQYWDPTDYPDLYTLRNNILSTYGNGSSLSLAQFAAINDVEAACFAFLGCFERAATPATFTTYRYPYAQQCWTILDQYAPTTGPDLLFVLKVLDNQHKRKFNSI